MIVWFVVLLSITVTASDIMAAGVAHTIANTHINKAVITVNGFVWKAMQNQLTINNTKQNGQQCVQWQYQPIGYGLF